MIKYFCKVCKNPFLITYNEQVKVEGKPDCPECGEMGGSPDILHQGEIYIHRYKVTRTWHVDAFSMDEAVQKAKNWNHDSIRVKRINKEEPFYE